MANKRPDGDGLVRKRSDGRWEGRIVVGHKEDGKPIYRSVFAKTQKELMEKLHRSIETFRDVELKENGSNATTEIDGEEVDLDSFFDNLFDIFGGTDALTPVGNLTLIDDILQNENTESVESVENEQKSKQFITVQSKNGNYFYIIIDRSGDTENVYFLNLVDEADLFALMETEEEPAETEPAPEPVCICEDKCITGEVNTKCEVCRLTMKECGGKEVVQMPDTPEPEEKDNSALLLIILLLAVGGGAAAWYFKMYKPKQNIKGSTELDDSYFEDEPAEEDPVEYEESEETEDKK